MPTNTLITKAALIASMATAATALAPAPASAAGGLFQALHVSPTGSAASDCQSSPCSLRHAVEDVAGTGAVIQADPGVYTLTSPLHVTASDVGLGGLQDAPRPVIKSAVSGPVIDSDGYFLKLSHLSLRASGFGAVGVSAPTMSLTDADVHVTGKYGTGVKASEGAVLENSSITTKEEGIGLQTSGDSWLVHATIWTGAEGIAASPKPKAPNSVVNVSVHDSIVHGDSNDLVLSGTSISQTAAANVDHSSFRPNHVQHDKFSYLNDKGGNSAATPLLADALNGDVHELAGSPTIDAGFADPSDGTSGMDGEARIQGKATDIGVDETAAPAAQAAGPSSQASAAAGAHASSAQHGAGTAKPPVLGALGMTPARFRVASAKTKNGGTRVTYTDSAAALTRFTVQRRTVRVKHGRRSVRWVTVTGSLVQRDRAGANAIAFSGTWGGRALAPGRYRLSAVARDGAGQTSAPATKAFRITR